MDKLNAIFANILDECRDDYVGLWSIARQVRECNRSNVMSDTLLLVRRLLSEGSIVAGQFSANEFNVWKVSEEQIIQNIENEWRRLGTEPTLGDIVWFTSYLRI